MAIKYSYHKANNEELAKAIGSNLNISLKKSVETLSAIKGMRVTSAKKYLEDVIDKKRPIPYKRFNQEVPHRRGKGIAAGGYPVSVAKELLTLLKNAESNAREKEISEELYIISASARKGARRFHLGRKMGQMMKSTHAEIIVGPKGGKKKND